MTEQQIAATALHADDIATIDGVTGDVVGRHILRPHKELRPAVHTAPTLKAPGVNFRAVIGPDAKAPAVKVVIVLRPCDATPEQGSSRDTTHRLEPDEAVGLERKGSGW